MITFTLLMTAYVSYFYHLTKSQRDIVRKDDRAKLDQRSAFQQVILICENSKIQPRFTGAVLGDEMGLGKSLTAIALILSEPMQPKLADEELVHIEEQEAPYFRTKATLSI
jgi:SNF2 family DNA or RNA helicase